jgi:plastocyanin domain-containing protein
MKSLLALPFVFFAMPAFADIPTHTLVIKDHKFSPAELTIPADTQVKLVIDNQDPTPEEFESNDFHKEKIIPGNSKGVVMVGPLEPGEYKFFGEFNLDTAQGILKVE